MAAALKIDDYEFDDESPLNSSDYEFEVETPTGLPSINQPTSATPAPTSGINVPPALQKAAEVAYTPVRGTRSIGVGIEKLLAGINPLKFSGAPGTQLDLADVQKIVANAGDALQSASAATQPGYVPAEGEKIGSFLGEAAGAAALTAPLAAAGATPLAAAGVNAAVGGGLTALQQASETGAVDPMSVAGTAALGGAIPLIKPMYQFLKGGVMKVLPEVLAKTQNTPVKATKILLDDPKVMEAFTGTEEAIRKQVDDVTGTLNQIRKEAGDQLGKVKLDLGLEVAPDEQIAKLANEGSKPALTPSGIAEAFQVRKQIPESQRLKYLYELKQQINDQVTFRPGVVKSIGSKEEGLLKQIATKADKEMQSLPGGARLKKANEQFSKAAGLYDDLQKKLETPGMAEDSLAKLFRGDLSVITEGRNKDVTALLGKLDEMAGKPVTQKLWKEMTVKNFKKALGRGLGPFFTGLGGVNLAAMTGGGMPAAVGAAIGAPLVSPRIAGLGIKAGAAVSPYIDRFLSTISNPKLQSAIVSAIATPKEKKK
jgi:hypothetical protein